MICGLVYVYIYIALISLDLANNGSDSGQDWHPFLFGQCRSGTLRSPAGHCPRCTTH